MDIIVIIIIIIVADTADSFVRSFVVSRHGAQRNTTMFNLMDADSV